MPEPAPTPTPLPTPTPITPDRTYDEATRRRLMYILVSGFYIYATVLAYAITGKTGYEMSAPAQAIIVMTLTAMISAVSLATGYYFGTTIGSAQKGAMIGQLQTQIASQTAPKPPTP